MSLYCKLLETVCSLDGAAECFHCSWYHVFDPFPEVPQRWFLMKLGASVLLFSLAFAMPEKHVRPRSILPRYLSVILHRLFFFSVPVLNSNSERWDWREPLLFQRTGVSFPTLMSGGSHLPVAPVPRGSINFPWLLWAPVHMWHILTRVYPHPCT